MWNEQNWTLVSMPVTSTRAQWDEGLRTVRQFNDLLRVLPPVPQANAGHSVARRSGSPSRPLKPAPARSEPLPPVRPEPTPGRADLPPSRADVLPPSGPEVGRYAQPRPEAGRAEPVRRPPPPPSRNGRQSPHYQR
jgi:hypothetical protein